MNAIMDAKDAISAKLAECWVTVDGNRYKLMQLTKFEAKFKINLTKVNILGRTGAGNKPAGWEGTWSATAHYNQSLFRRMLLEYKKTGKMPTFDITVTNEDPGSNVGRQTLILYNSLIEEGILAKFDASAETLDEDLSGKFDDFDMPEEFAQLAGMVA